MCTKRGIFLSLFISGCITGAASSQIVPVDPFVGDYSEGFEGNQVIFLPCMPDRVFDATADLCTPGNSGCHTTTGWGFYCSIYPHSGTWFFGSAGGYAEYEFDLPVRRFGGYWGTNANQNDGYAIFYDEAGNNMGQVDIIAPADCTWTWNGWESQGAAISRVATYGNAYNGPFLMQDDMEYSLKGLEGLILEVTGPCPGRMDACIRGAEKGDRIGFAYGFNSGLTSVPPCPGLKVEIANAKLAGLTVADVNGEGCISGKVPAAICGRGLVQAVNVSKCELSNVVAI